MANLANLVAQILLGDTTSQSAASVVAANPDQAYLSTSNLPNFNYKSLSNLLYGVDNAADFPNAIVGANGEKIGERAGIQIAYSAQESIENPKDSFNSDSVGALNVYLEVLCKLDSNTDINPATQLTTVRDLDLRVAYLIDANFRSKRFSLIADYEVSAQPAIPGGYDASIDPANIEPNLIPLSQHGGGVQIFWLKHQTYPTLYECVSLYKIECNLVVLAQPVA